MPRVTDAAALEAVDQGGEPVRVVLRAQLEELTRAREHLAEVQYGYGIPADLWRRTRDGIEGMQLVTRALLARSEQLLTKPERLYRRR